MNIVQNILYNNDCYKAGRKITVSGLMLHSIGTPQPDPMVFIRNWNRSGVDKCVHGFIRLDGTVFQTLPWNHRGWHAGGAANNTHIGIEMCEPATIKYISGSRFEDLNPAATKAYVFKMYKEAVELFAHLAKLYKLNPLTQIISHREGYLKGVASGHGDPEHLWSKYGLTMNQFRYDVKAYMEGPKVEASSYPTAFIGQKGDNVKTLQTNLVKLGYNPKGVDGIYGPGTEAAVRLFQKNNGLVIDGQAGPKTQEAIKKAIEAPKAPEPAPIPQPVKVVVYRRGYKGEDLKFYQSSLTRLGFNTNGIDGIYGPGMEKAVRLFQTKHGLTIDGILGPITQNKIKFEIGKLSYQVKITASVLNVREKPNTSSKIVATVKKDQVYIITDVQNGWGLLKSGAGWISLKYTKKL